MEKRVTPLRRVTSPTWGPLCKQALRSTFFQGKLKRWNKGPGYMEVGDLRSVR